MNVIRNASPQPNQSRNSKRHGFTLAEVVMSLAVALITVTSISTAYVNIARQSQWSGCSAAANAALVWRMEQVRGARWDPRASPPIDELVVANFPIVTQALNLPISGTNSITVTNQTTIQTIRVNPPLRLVRVDCTWKFPGGKVYTNSLVVYRSPDP